MSLTRARYRLTPDTLGDGQWTDLRVDANGALIVESSGGAATVFDVTLSTDTSAYADGDTFADTQLVSATFFEASGADRTLLNVVVLDKADQGFGIDLFFLDTNVALGTENAAPSITDTNAESIVGFVRISSGDWIDVGGARIAVINNISQVLRSTTQNLYIAAVVRGAGTYGASDVIVKLGVL